MLYQKAQPSHKKAGKTLYTWQMLQKTLNKQAKNTEPKNLKPEQLGILPKNTTTIIIQFVGKDINLPDKKTKSEQTISEQFKELPKNILNK